MNEMRLKIGLPPLSDPEADLKIRRSRRVIVTLPSSKNTKRCRNCGGPNRDGNKYCALCKTAF